MSNLLNTTASDILELEVSIGQALKIKEEIDQIETGRLQALKATLDGLKVKIQRDMGRVGLKQADGIVTDIATGKRVSVGMAKLTNGKTQGKIDEKKLAEILDPATFESIKIKGKSFEYVRLVK